MFYCDLSLFRFSNVSSDCVHFKDVIFSSLSNIDTFIKENVGLSKDDYYILLNGKIVDIIDNTCKIDEGTLRIVPRTNGGKGGFGSMLRAIGAQIEKTTNREACRDLSGRRLRDINEEQRLKNWISQQADREREAAERKKNKLERLCQEPKHEFKDETYDEHRTTMPEKMSTSIEQGLKASSSCSSSSNLKRKHNADKNKTKTSKKKKTLWIDAEDNDSSSNSDSEVEDRKSISTKA